MDLFLYFLGTLVVAISAGMLDEARKDRKRKRDLIENEKKVQVLISEGHSEDEARKILRKVQWEKSKKNKNKSSSKPKARYLDGSKCPKCGSQKFYKQPMTIVRPAGLGSMTEDFNVPFCNDCNVEFVPRYKM